MSDRPQGSVRTEARAGEAAGHAPSPAGSSPAAGQPPVSATQSIPTGGVRAQAPAGGGAAAGGPVGGVAPGIATGARPGVAGRARGKSGGKAGRGPRRARLQLRHIDTWSAFKISFVLSVALFFIWMVAIGILYGVLSGLGVFNTLNDLFGQLGSASGSKSSGNLITPGVVLGGAAVIGAINIILMTALCTVGTFIYNMCADLVGGLEVTLSERD
jgi:hypothetical protein